MLQGPPISASFFPSSNALITGGTFTIQNNTYIHDGGKGGYERLLEFVAPNALHDSGHVVDPPKCHPGTRVAIIQMITDWVAESDELHRDNHITWLTGSAGAGKSAIGRSVCEQCAEEGTLLASFFFGSNDPTRNHSKSLVATIAYQVCAINPGIRKAVSDFIEYDPLIFTRSLRAQFSSLIIDPLLANYANAPHKVPPLIVLDGLDECSDKASQRDILETVLWVVTTSSIPIRVLICSRSENNITAAFSTVRMSASVFKIFLGNEYRPDDDIRLYLQDHFDAIREEHIFRLSIPPSWPTKEQKNQLVRKSSGQFIYAYTVIRYLKSPRHRPHQRLDVILGLRPPFKDLPFAELDALYSHLLNNTDDPSLTSDIMAFLSLYTLMPTPVIEKYLELADGEVEIVLSDLAAIVKMEINHSGVHQASLLHKSFADFLFDFQRSKHLYRNREDTRARHLIRLLQIFSGSHKGCRFQYTWSGALILVVIQNIPGHDMADTLRSRLIDELTNFPMESCFKELLSHNLTRCHEHMFIRYFLSILSELEKKKLITGVYSRHILSVFNTLLSELLREYSDHWETNLSFAVTWICRPPRRVQITWSGFASVIQDICFPSGIFTIPSNNVEELGIISRAAAYCLQFLADVVLTHQEAKNHFTIGCIGKTKRRASPYVWNRRYRHGFRKRHVFIGVYYADKKCVSLSTYEKLLTKEYPYRPLFSVTSMRWHKWKTSDWTPEAFEVWYQYMVILEYLPLILLRAGKFPPLIRLSRTRSFAPLSMLFPDLSRRARRAITVYLDRMDSKIRIDGVA